jgi:lipopolysaccharide/colanic/teichoic acid biosynthesis glycosyltransferase
MPVVMGSAHQRRRFGGPGRPLANLFVAVGLVIVTLPLMVLVAVAIKCDSQGPVFCRTQCVAARGRRFLALRFRTTTHPDDVRCYSAWQDLTRVGRFLRVTRIDHLPQLINVLRGEMSCVNPGPERPFFLN